MKRLRAMLLIALVLGCRDPRPGPGHDTGNDATTTQGSGDEGESTNSGSADTTQADSETATGSDDATDFAPEGDLGSADPVECDPFVQDCADGEKCVAYGAQGQGWIGYKCVPVLGDKAPGEACAYDGFEAGTDDCDATSACWLLFGGGGPFEGTCTPLCLGTADEPECDPGFGCFLAQGVTQTVCIPTWCDPLLDECEGMTDCYWVGDAFECRVPLGAAGVGEPCTEPRDCLASNVCASAATVPECVDTSCCTPLCELDLGDIPCDAALPGTVCVPFFEPDIGPEWFAHVGVCILP